MPGQGDSTLRKVRTFADDIRRAGGTVPGDAPKAPTRPAPIASSLAMPELEAVESVRSLEDGRLDIRSTPNEDATIVSEHRVHKWSFTDAATESLSSWWKGMIAEMKKGAPEPKVAPASTRIATIKAASAGARLAPQDDHRSLVEKIKARPPETLARVATPVAPPPPSEPQWTHTTPSDDASPLPPPVPAVSAPPVVEREIPPPPTPEPEVRETFTGVSRYSPQPIPSESQWRSASSAPAVVPERDLQAEYATPRKVPPPPVPVNKSIGFVERARAAALARRAQAEALGIPERPPVALYLGGVVVIGFILALVAALAYVITTRDTPLNPSSGGPTTLDTKEPFFPVEASVPVVLSSQKEELLSDLKKRVLDAGGPSGTAIHYYFVYATDASDAALPAHALIDTLRLRAPGSFLRTIDTRMMFGSWIGSPNAPFLILKVKNYQEALGGMLLWEESLNADLSPLFGEDHGSLGYRTLFTDRILAGRDVRILENSDGEVVTVYGFVDNSTLVITTTPEAWIGLANEL